MRWVRLEEAIERFVLRRADIVAVQNEDNRAFVVSTGVPRDRTAIFRLGNMIHPIHFSDPDNRPDAAADLEELGLRAGTKAIACIARLIPEKMLDHVLRAIAELTERDCEATVIFIGDGPIREQLTALARDLGIGHLVRFAGNRDQEWLSRVMPLLDAVVSPLTGRALAEAGLGGAPVAAYAIDWQPEVIRTGETGELVPPGDWRGMADAIERLLRNPDYARHLGAQLRRELAETMDPKAIDRAQAEVYDQILKRRS